MMTLMLMIAAVFAFPAFAAAHALRGWAVERVAIASLRNDNVGAIVAPKRARTTKTELLTRYSVEEIDSVRRVLIAARLDARAAMVARDVEVLRLGDIRRAARKARQAQRAVA